MLSQGRRVSLQSNFIFASAWLLTYIRLHPRTSVMGSKSTCVVHLEPQIPHFSSLRPAMIPALSLWKVGLGLVFLVLSFTEGANI